MKDSSSNPDEQTVQDWLVKIQGAIEGCVTLVYSTRLASILKNRAKLLKWKVKNATGSAKKMQYLQGLWELCVEESEIDKENQPSPKTSYRKRTAKHYSKRHERRLKRQRIDQCSKSLCWLEEEGFTPVEIVVQNETTEDFETICINRDLEKALQLRAEKVSTTDCELISMMLYIKDKHNISGSAYHEIASICKDLPRSHRNIASSDL